MISANEIKMVRSLSEKKFRDRTGLFIAEGEKMADEAARSGFKVEKIYRREEIGDATMRRISATTSGTPALAVIRKPLDINIEDISEHFRSNKRAGLFLALDTIRDPGNLGTILRIADWFGIDTVFASHGTVDLFNPKVVQATMGAIFRVKFHYTDIPQLCRAVRENGGDAYGTFLDGKDIYRCSLNPGLERPSVIIIGNESEGISPEVEAEVTGRLFIPSYPAGSTGSESLNAAVATAITVAEFRRIAEYK